MKFVLLMMFVIPALCLCAQQGEYDEASAITAKGLNTSIPLPSSQGLSVTEREGKRLFIQRCSVCHLPGTLTSLTYAPLLDKNVVATLGNGAVRNYIMNGSDKMPGWQYTLSSGQVDKIIAYLNTLSFSK